MVTMYVLLLYSIWSTLYSIDSTNGDYTGVSRTLAKKLSKKHTANVRKKLQQRDVTLKKRLQNATNLANADNNEYDILSMKDVLGKTRNKGDDRENTDSIEFNAYLDQVTRNDYNRRLGGYLNLNKTINVTNYINNNTNIIPDDTSDETTNSNSNKQVNSTTDNDQENNINRYVNNMSEDSSSATPQNDESSNGDENDRRDSSDRGAGDSSNRGGDLSDRGGDSSNRGVKEKEKEKDPDIESDEKAFSFDHNKSDAERTISLADKIDKKIETINGIKDNGCGQKKSEKVHDDVKKKIINEDSFNENEMDPNPEKNFTLDENSTTENGENVEDILKKKTDTEEDKDEMDYNDSDIDPSLVKDLNNLHQLLKSNEGEIENLGDVGGGEGKSAIDRYTKVGNSIGNGAKMTKIGRVKTREEKTSDVKESKSVLNTGLGIINNGNITVKVNVTVNNNQTKKVMAEQTANIEKSVKIDAAKEITDFIDKSVKIKNEIDKVTTAEPAKVNSGKSAQIGTEVNNVMTNKTAKIKNELNAGKFEKKGSLEKNAKTNNTSNDIKSSKEGFNIIGSKEKLSNFDITITKPEEKTLTLKNISKAQTVNKNTSSKVGFNIIGTKEKLANFDISLVKPKDKVYETMQHQSKSSVNNSSSQLEKKANKTNKTTSSPSNMNSSFNHTIDTISTTSGKDTFKGGYAIHDDDNVLSNFVISTVDPHGAINKTSTVENKNESEGGRANTSDDKNNNESVSDDRNASLSILKADATFKVKTNESVDCNAEKCSVIKNATTEQNNRRGSNNESAKIDNEQNAAKDTKSGDLSNKTTRGNLAGKQNSNVDKIDGNEHKSFNQSSREEKINISAKEGEGVSKKNDSNNIANNSKNNTNDAVKKSVKIGNIKIDEPVPPKTEELLTSRDNDISIEKSPKMHHSAGFDDDSKSDVLTNPAPKVDEGIKGAEVSLKFTNSVANVGAGEKTTKKTVKIGNLKIADEPLKLTQEKKDALKIDNVKYEEPPQDVKAEKMTSVKGFDADEAEFDQHIEKSSQLYNSPAGDLNKPKSDEEKIVEKSPVLMNPAPKGHYKVEKIKIKNSDNKNALNLNNTKGVKIGTVNTGPIASAVDNSDPRIEKSSSVGGIDDPITGPGNATSNTTETEKETNLFVDSDFNVTTSNVTIRPMTFVERLEKSFENIKTDNGTAGSNDGKSTSTINSSNTTKDVQAGDATEKSSTLPTNQNASGTKAHTPSTNNIMAPHNGSSAVTEFSFDIGKMEADDSNIRIQKYEDNENDNTDDDDNAGGGASSSSKESTYFLDVDDKTGEVKNVGKVTEGNKTTGTDDHVAWVNKEHTASYKTNITTASGPGPGDIFLDNIEGDNKRVTNMTDAGIPLNSHHNNKLMNDSVDIHISRDDNNGNKFVVSVAEHGDTAAAKQKVHKKGGPDETNGDIYTQDYDKELIKEMIVDNMKNKSETEVLKDAALKDSSDLVQKYNEEIKALDMDNDIAENNNAGASSNNSISDIMTLNSNDTSSSQTDKTDLQNSNIQPGKQEVQNSSREATKTDSENSSTQPAITDAHNSSKEPSKPDSDYTDSDVISRNLNSFEVDGLVAHNLVRNIHGSPDMIVDPKLSDKAVKRAKQLAINGASSATSQKPGENVFISCAMNVTADHATRKWYNEICESGYDFMNEGPQPGTGHFTQVIWKSSTTLGIGKSIIAAENGTDCTYIVALYKDSGNIVGTFKKNLDKGTFSEETCQNMNALFPGTESVDDGTDKKTLTAPAPEIIIDPNFSEDGLRAHNIFRNIHESQNMTLDPALTNSAKAHALALSERDSFSSVPEECCENIFIQCASRVISASEAVKEWYSEVCEPGYDFEPGGANTKDTNHFTQLIWKESNLLGMGIATKQLLNGSICSYIVARYNPPGNNEGMFTTNVDKGLFTMEVCTKLDQLGKLPEDLVVEAGDIEDKYENEAKDGDTSAVSTFEKEGLEEHNKWRSVHGAQQMDIDPLLSSSAKIYARKLADMETSKHINGQSGENIYIKCSSKESTAKEAVDAWYAEVCDPPKYEFNLLALFPAKLHFTQVVWDKSTILGIGMANKKAENGSICSYVVARYNPPGNTGAMEQNVFKGKFNKEVCQSLKSDHATTRFRIPSYHISRKIVDHHFNPEEGENKESTLSTLENEALEAHNEFRMIHGAKNLTIDPLLSDSAQTDAIKFAYEHLDGTDRPGKNFFVRCSAEQASARVATKTWYREVCDEKYDFESDKSRPETQHFSQIVWNDTSLMGIGLATKKSENDSICTYIVVHYNPPGNTGKPTDNVLRGNFTQKVCDKLNSLPEGESWSVKISDASMNHVAGGGPSIGEDNQEDKASKKSNLLRMRLRKYIQFSEKTTSDYFPYGLH